MGTYLSIDLDYWRFHYASVGCTRFFQRVWRLGLPIYVTIHHHYLIPHIDESGCERIVNVDWHSDLAESPNPISDRLNEGVWGNYVSWRKEGWFDWRYPSEQCTESGPRRGYCHDEINPFFDPSVAEWHKATKRLGLSGLPWGEINAVGVCLSPAWIGGRGVLHEPITRLGLQTLLRRQDWDHLVDSNPIGLISKLVRVK